MVVEEDWFKQATVLMAKSILYSGLQPMLFEPHRMGQYPAGEEKPPLCACALGG